MKLLLVDDDIPFSKALRASIEDHYQVDTANSYLEALSSVESGHFDILVTDYFLPDGNGLSLISASKNKNPNLKSILISGSATKEIAIDCLRLKVDSILEKPFTSQEIYQELVSIAPLNVSKQILIKTNPNELVLKIENFEFQLTSTEFKIFDTLYKQNGQRIDRHSLIKKIWNGDTISENAFDTHLGNLKKKISPYDCIISNKKGVGYCLNLTK